MNKQQKIHKSILPGHALGVKVINNDLSFAIKQFKGKVKDSDILSSLKERREFEKPSVTKRKQLIKARYIQSKQHGE
jgi:small subunit ribosomal protein S21